jgi:hypothetical protein
VQCGLASAVCSTYRFTNFWPDCQLATISSSTRVPWSWCHWGSASSRVTTGLFLRVSIWMSKEWVGLPFPVREITRMGWPVVSCPYMAAALMPMPCWPRDCLSRWNLEP